MKTKNFRYVQHSDRARIEHDLTLSRIGEMTYRDINVLIRAFLFNNPSVKAVVIEGLDCSPGSGLSVNYTFPTSVIQILGDNNLISCFEGNDGNATKNIVLNAADSSNPRIDILEAQIDIRNGYNDVSVNVVDPLTLNITPQTRNRDFEIYLKVQKITGTPAAIPASPISTAATAATVLGTVSIPTTIDLSAQYILSLSNGIDGNFVEIDLRGATPNATTLAEIIANINAAGFGTIASASGNYLLLTGTGVGENSLIRIKRPLDPTLDALNEVLGIVEIPGYFLQYKGANAWFKFAEIFVPTSSVTLIANDIRTRFEKDTEWISEAATIENSFSFESHRKSVPMDHSNASVEDYHLAASTLALISTPHYAYYKTGVI